VSEYLGLSVGKDQCQFVREPLSVMQNPGTVFFLFFPMVCELDRPPVGDVTIFSLAEYPVEHSRCAQQADMPAMKRCERPPFDIATVWEEGHGPSVGRLTTPEASLLLRPTESPRWSVRLVRR